MSARRLEFGSSKLEVVSFKFWRRQKDERVGAAR